MKGKGGKGGMGGMGEMGGKGGMDMMVPGAPGMMPPGGPGMMSGPDPEVLKVMKETQAIPMLFVNAHFEVEPAGQTLPMMVDTAAQTSSMTSFVAQRLGLMGKIDRRYAGEMGGVGSTRILGRLSGVGVQLGELSLEMNF